MQPNHKLDELTLNAYVDGQLDTELERAVLNAMENDAGIREQVHALRRAKDWMRSGFADAELPQRKLTDSSGWRKRVYTGIAATLMMFAIGTGGGILGYKLSGNAHTGYKLSGNAHTAVAMQEDPSRVILHLDESDPERFAALLDYTEYLLSKNNAPGMQVEVIANAGGIDLVRAGVSPYEQRVRLLSATYANLHFIACANAVRNLRNSGEEAILIDHVHAGETAVDHIVDRLRAGWTYRKVTDLPEI
jgi:intracellular sulfur oxidation DsrE/DsrF family protein